MKCDEGYQCEVCGDDVTSIIESDLYLRFVIGELDPELLHRSPERHIRCNPILAQFILDDRFDPVVVDGPMSADQLDPTFVQHRQEIVSRGFRRLHEISNWPDKGDLREYPLPEAIESYRKS